MEIFTFYMIFFSRKRFLKKSELFVRRRKQMKRYYDQPNINGFCHIKAVLVVFFQFPLLF